MYTARIERKDTLEILEAQDCTLREALRLVNVAWFASGYQDEVLDAQVIDQETGRTLEAWWTIEDEDEEV